MGPGKYRVVFTVSGYTAGQIRPIVGTTGAGTLVGANGTFMETVAYGGTGSTFFLEGDADFTGSVDDVSVKRI